jgi:hypothetical protein
VPRDRWRANRVDTGTARATAVESRRGRASAK